MNNELKILFNDGFPNDSNEFRDFFFNTIEDKNNIITYKEDNKIISVLYITNKFAHVFGTKKSFPYISTVSTLTEYRGKGKLLNVMNKAFSKLYDDGALFTALYPFNHEFYKKFGFTNASFGKSLVINGGTVYDCRKACSDDVQSLLNIYIKMSESFENYIIYNEKMIKNKLTEYEVDGIDCLIYSLGGEDKAFAFIENDMLAFYAGVDNCINNIENLKGYKYFDFYYNDEPYIQTRIINAIESIKAYRFHRNLTITKNIKIVDKIIKQNNITISIEIVNSKVIISRCEQYSDIIDISQLTDYMFNGGFDIFNTSQNLFIDKF